MKGTVGSDKEGNMEQMIFVVLAIVALCWGLRATPWKTVKARVRVAQDVSLRRLRKRL
jgi:hypothetical protein